MKYPVSWPTTANRSWPRVSISATRSSARVPVSYPSRGLSVSPMPRWRLLMPGQLRHQQAPGVPVLGPAVHQQQRRAVTSDDRVLAQSAGVYVPARECVGEPFREVRRAGDGAGAFLAGQVGGG